jgi:hypothetical protein
MLGIPGVSSAAIEVWLHGAVTSTDIQQALDSLPSGGLVHVPPGLIAVSKPIVLSRDGLGLMGTSNTVLRLDDGANCPVIIMGEPVNHPKLVSNLGLANISIDGNQTGQAHECWVSNKLGNQIRNNGVTVQAVKDSVITNVECYNCRSGGLVTTLGVSNLLVSAYSGCSNRYDGLACYLTVFSTFRGLHLSGNKGAGISLDLHFDWNHILDARMIGNDIGIFMRNSRNNEVANIRVEKPGSYGVFLSRVDDKPATGATGNKFTGIDVSECERPVWINSTSCLENVFALITPMNGVKLASTVGTSEDSLP